MLNAIANVSLFYTFFCQPTLQIASNLLDERHKEQWNELQKVITKQYVSAYRVFSHSRGQHLCKFNGTKESVCIRKEFNSHRTGLGHQHGRRLIVLGHQYGRRDVMWKHCIDKI